jgi:NAD(P)-dependent dehydrogenase (short-subunit alcohol dehydrogenase family)
MPKEKTKQFGANTIFGRAAQPVELAPIFVFLASDEASYVAGEVYGATGGQRGTFMGLTAQNLPSKFLS